MDAGDQEGHLRELQQEYLNFLDDEVSGLQLQFPNLKKHEFFA